MLMRRRWSLVVAMAVLLAAAVSSTAYAQSDDNCRQLRWVVTGVGADGNPEYGWRTVNVCDDTGDDGGGGGSSTCQHPDPAVGEVPCYDDAYGWWSSSYECYVQLASNQPPAGDPDWDGNDPDDGAIYVLTCPEVIGGAVAWGGENVFLAQAPNLPSVADLAAQAMESLPLAPVEIGIAPSPDGVGLVGVPVWLWVSNADAGMGPVSVSVPGPGITVTATAEVAEVEWDMGDGTVRVCDGPGEPYQPSFGGREPECGYTYPLPSSTQPDGRYQVVATTVWHAEWSATPGGESGQETFDRTSDPVSIQINELQVVTG